MRHAAPTRPILRYPGGKWRLAPWILSRFPPHQCYVEPFCGASACFFQKPRSYAEVLNDLDGEIVALFRVLRDPAQAQELERLLRLTPYSRVEYDEALQPAATPIEHARRMLTRSWQGFTGDATLGGTSGWRQCITRGGRGGPLPSHDWGRFPRLIQAFTARLQGVMIEQADAMAVFARYDSPETLWYVDPPYVPETCPGFHGYRHTVEHTALRRALQHLRGMVVLSGYRSAAYDTLYEDWERVDHHACAGSGKGGRRHRVESLWLNPACARAGQQRSLFAGATS